MSIRLCEGSGRVKQIHATYKECRLMLVTLWKMSWEIWGFPPLLPCFNGFARSSHSRVSVFRSQNQHHRLPLRWQGPRCKCREYRRNMRSLTSRSHYFPSCLSSHELAGTKDRWVVQPMAESSMFTFSFLPSLYENREGHSHAARDSCSPWGLTFPIFKLWFLKNI